MVVLTVGTSRPSPPCRPSASPRPASPARLPDGRACWLSCGTTCLYASPPGQPPVTPPSAVQLRLPPSSSRARAARHRRHARAPRARRAPRPRPRPPRHIIAPPTSSSSAWSCRTSAAFNRAYMAIKIQVVSCSGDARQEGSQPTADCPSIRTRRRQLASIAPHRDERLSKLVSTFAFVWRDRLDTHEYPPSLLPRPHPAALRPRLRSPRTRSHAASRRASWSRASRSCTSRTRASWPRRRPSAAPRPRTTAARSDASRRSSRSSPRACGGLSSCALRRSSSLNVRFVVVVLPFPCLLLFKPHLFPLPPWKSWPRPRPPLRFLCRSPPSPLGCSLC